MVKFQEYLEVLKHRKKMVAFVAVLLGVFVLGYFAGSDRKPGTPALSRDQRTISAEVGKKPATDRHDAGSAAAHLWTCSMHPQIKLPHAGKCPICFMDLIPLVSGKEDDAGPSVAQYSMSETAKRLAEVETAEVKRKQAKVKVRMVGLVYEDETRIAALTSRVDGRLDEVYVNFTGVQVSKGDPMVKIWSPTLIKSQVELFETATGSIPDDAVSTGAEEKLIQLGLTRDQIENIKQQKKPDLYITLRAPISGIVTKRMAFLGQFVKEGTEMYIINDLSRVWVKMDAYETDIPWIRYGQDVTFTTPAFPGREFKGKVLFIDPMLDTKTRSVKVRVEAENPEFSLKPGMFVTAQVEAEIDSQGRVIKSEWTGKYICPIHPRDQVSSEPGKCPDSNMPLRPAAAFGYADDKEPVLPLVIPASAPLITGKRAVVYVEVPGRDRPTYEIREVVLGPRAGDEYVVYKGLKEGERVVSKGNFKIDSAMQILARSSMMKPIEAKEPEQKAEDEVIEKIPVSVKFLEGLSPVIQEYLTLKEALVNENREEAAKAAQKIAELLRAEKQGALDEKATREWKKISVRMSDNLKSIQEGKDLEAMRVVFDPLSESFVRMLMTFRHSMEKPLFVFHCPMAFNSRGAYWIEASEDRRNPYFGEKPFKGQDMLKCAELVEKIPPEATGDAATGKASTLSVSGEVDRTSLPHLKEGGQ